jgi:hypothetical protein
MSARIRHSAFQPFSWLSDDLCNDDAANFAARVKDLSSGVHKCLQLIEISELEREEGRDDADHQGDPSADLPLLSVTDTSILLRLAITVTQIIAERAERVYLDSEIAANRAAQPVAADSDQEARHG